MTTIPASAFVGVAVGMGEIGRIWSALAVLGINIAMMLAGGSIVLATQRVRSSRFGIAPPRS